MAIWQLESGKMIQGFQLLPVSFSPKFFLLLPPKAKTNSHLTYFGKHIKYLNSFPLLKLWSGPFHSVVIFYYTSKNDLYIFFQHNQAEKGRWE